MKTIFAALTAIALSAGMASAGGIAYDRENNLGIFDKREASSVSVEMGSATGFLGNPGHARQHNHGVFSEYGDPALFGLVEAGNSVTAGGGHNAEPARDPSGGWPGYQ